MSKSKSRPAALDGDDLYAAEAILDKKVNALGKTLYLIKWVGWGHQYNTWEPEQNIASEDLLREFEERQQKGKTFKQPKRPFSHSIASTSSHKSSKKSGESRSKRPKKTKSSDHDSSTETNYWSNVETEKEVKKRLETEDNDPSDRVLSSRSNSFSRSSRRSSVSSRRNSSISNVNTVEEQVRDDVTEAMRGMPDPFNSQEKVSTESEQTVNPIIVKITDNYSDLESNYSSASDYSNSKTNESNKTVITSLMSSENTLGFEPQVVLERLPKLVFKRLLSNKTSYQLSIKPLDNQNSDINSQTISSETISDNVLVVEKNDFNNNNNNNCVEMSDKIVDKVVVSAESIVNSDKETISDSVVPPLVSPRECMSSCLAVCEPEKSPISDLKQTSHSDTNVSQITGESDLKSNADKLEKVFKPLEEKTINKESAEECVEPTDENVVQIEDSVETVDTIEEIVESNAENIVSVKECVDNNDKNVETVEENVEIEENMETIGEKVVPIEETVETNEELVSTQETDDKSADKMDVIDNEKAFEETADSTEAIDEQKTPVFIRVIDSDENGVESPIIDVIEVDNEDVEEVAINEKIVNRDDSIDANLEDRQPSVSTTEEPNGSPAIGEEEEVIQQSLSSDVIQKSSSEKTITKDFNRLIDKNIIQNTDREDDLDLDLTFNDDIILDSIEEQTIAANTATDKTRDSKRDEMHDLIVSQYSPVSDDGLDWSAMDSHSSQNSVNSQMSEQLLSVGKDSVQSMAQNSDSNSNPKPTSGEEQIKTVDASDCNNNNKPIDDIIDKNQSNSVPEVLSTDQQIVGQKPDERNYSPIGIEDLISESQESQTSETRSQTPQPIGAQWTPQSDYINDRVQEMAFRPRIEAESDISSMPAPPNITTAQNIPSLLSHPIPTQTQTTQSVPKHVEQPLSIDVTQTQAINMKDKSNGELTTYSAIICDVILSPSQDSSPIPSPNHPNHNKSAINSSPKPMSSQSTDALSHPTEALSHPTEALSHPTEALSHPTEPLSHPTAVITLNSSVSPPSRPSRPAPQSLPVTTNESSVADASNWPLLSQTNHPMHPPLRATGVRDRMSAPVMSYNSPNPYMPRSAPTQAMPRMHPNISNDGSIRPPLTELSSVPGHVIQQRMSSSSQSHIRNHPYVSQYSESISISSRSHRSSQMIPNNCRQPTQTSAQCYPSAPNRSDLSTATQMHTMRPDINRSTNHSAPDVMHRSSGPSNIQQMAPELRAQLMASHMSRTPPYPPQMRPISVPMTQSSIMSQMTDRTHNQYMTPPYDRMRIPFRSSAPITDYSSHLQQRLQQPLPQQPSHQRPYPYPIERTHFIGNPMPAHTHPSPQQTRPTMRMPYMGVECSPNRITVEPRQPQGVREKIMQSMARNPGPYMQDNRHLARNEGLNCLDPLVIRRTHISPVMDSLSRQMANNDNISNKEREVVQILESGCFRPNDIPILSNRSHDLRPILSQQKANQLNVSMNINQNRNPAENPKILERLLSQNTTNESLANPSYRTITSSNNNTENIGIDRQFGLSSESFHNVVQPSVRSVSVSSTASTPLLPISIQKDLLSEAIELSFDDDLNTELNNENEDIIDLSSTVDTTAEEATDETTPEEGQYIYIYADDAENLTNDDLVELFKNQGLQVVESDSSESQSIGTNDDKTEEQSENDLIIQIDDKTLEEVTKENSGQLEVQIMVIDDNDTNGTEETNNLQTIDTNCTENAIIEDNGLVVDQINEQTIDKTVDNYMNFIECETTEEIIIPNDDSVEMDVEGVVGDMSSVTPTAPIESTQYLSMPTFDDFDDQNNDKTQTKDSENSETIVEQIENMDTNEECIETTEQSLQTIEENNENIVKEIEETVKEVESTPKEVENNVKELETNVKELETNVKELETNVKEVENTEENDKNIETISKTTFERIESISENEDKIKEIIETSNESQENVYKSRKNDKNDELIDGNIVQNIINNLEKDINKTNLESKTNESFVEKDLQINDRVMKSCDSLTTRLQTLQTDNTNTNDSNGLHFTQRNSETVIEKVVDNCNETQINDKVLEMESNIDRIVEKANDSENNEIIAELKETAEEDISSEDILVIDESTETPNPNVTNVGQSEGVQHPFVSSSVEDMPNSPSNSSFCETPVPTNSVLQHNTSKSGFNTTEENDFLPNLTDSEDEVLSPTTTTSAGSIHIIANDMNRPKSSKFRENTKTSANNKGLVDSDVPLIHNKSIENNSNLSKKSSKSGKKRKQKLDLSSKPPKKTMNIEDERKVLHLIKSRLNGWDKGWTPEEIVGINSLDESLVFLVNWTNGEQTIVISDVANHKCPQLVIKFYEKHSVWDEDDV